MEGSKANNPKLSSELVLYELVAPTINFRAYVSNKAAVFQSLSGRNDCRDNVTGGTYAAGPELPTIVHVGSGCAL